MANPPPNPGAPRPPRKFGPFRIWKTPDGKRHIAFGEVDPTDPWIQQGAKDTGGVIITGEKHGDRGVLTFNVPDAPEKKKPPEAPTEPTDPENRG